MSRSAWLAIGATSAALALAGKVAWPAILLTGAGALALLALGGMGRGAGATPSRVRRVVAPAAVGVLLIAIRLGVALAGPDGEAVVAALPAGPGPWSSTVVSVGSPLDGRQTATLRLEIPGRPLVAASLPRYPSVEPGDRLRVGGTTRAPDDGDYGRYLERIGVAGTLRATSMEPLGPSTDPAWALERFRRASAEALTRALPEPEAGLAAGILIGLRDRVDRQLATDFTTAGASHVVAISGWNIAIVGALVAALARGLPRRRRAIVTIAAIAVYVVFAGASPSVLRAAAMAGVVLLARESGRAGRAAAALGWAATLLLVADPSLVLDPGFQLSTVATAGLMAWATPITERLAGPSPGRLRAWLAESLGVSLAAQAATLPIVLATFGRLSVVAPLVNLGVVPLVAPAMAAGAGALLAGWLVAAGLPAGAALIAGLPAWAILALIVALVRLGAGLPFASIGLDPPWSAAAGVVAAALILGAAFRRRRSPRRQVDAGSGGAGRDRGSPQADGHASSPGGRSAARPGRAPATGARRFRLAGVLLGLSAASLGLVAAHAPDGATRLVFLDIGQGDAILVEGARGGRMLVDTGPDPDRLLVALDERLPPWDRRLDVVVISHPHEDHVAGLALLLERYRIGRVLDPGMAGPGPGYSAATAALDATGVRHGTLATGDRLVLDALSFRVLWPDPGRVPAQPPSSGVGINNVSIVMIGDVDGRHVLLTGDAEQDVDPELVSRGLAPIDVLKVAHHGSATATTDRLLDALSPAVAVISVGTGNSYGHPAPATIGRLQAHGAIVLRTDQRGTIEVTINGGRLTARGERGTVLADLPRRSGPAFAASSPARVGRGESTAGPPARLPAAPGGRVGLLYHRLDDRPRARGRRRPAPLARSPSLVRPPRAGGRRGGVVAGRRGRPPRGADGPQARRGGRAPPRRGQAAPTW